jgi:transposase
METIVERPAALDVHKASVTACVRVPAADGGRDEHVEQFATTVQGLLTLADWLEAHGVRQVAMEATGVYWKPVWAVLEDRFDCLLVNARHVKQVPGRKTDVLDAQWLCQLLEAGLLKPSLVPPKPIRTLRNLTRYRKSNIRDRQREANRLHKLLEDTGIKLDCVATDLLGRSGRAMLDALVSGTTDPDVLADLARGQLRRKLPALREALEGRSTQSTCWSSGRSSLTSTSWTSRSTVCRPRSRSRSPRSRRRLSCSARSPACSAAPPRSSSPRPAAT